MNDIKAPKLAPISQETIVEDMLFMESKLAELGTIRIYTSIE